MSDLLHKLASALRRVSGSYYGNPVAADKAAADEALTEYEQLRSADALAPGGTVWLQGVPNPVETFDPATGTVSLGGLLGGQVPLQRVELPDHRMCIVAMVDARTGDASLEAVEAHLQRALRDAMNHAGLRSTSTGHSISLGEPKVSVAHLGAPPCAHLNPAAEPEAEEADGMRP